MGSLRENHCTSLDHSLSLQVGRFPQSDAFLEKLSLTTFIIYFFTQCALRK